MPLVWNSADVASGDTITAEQYNDLRADLLLLFTSMTPIGAQVVWGGTVANIPDGWLLCDGSAISRATYADYFALADVTYGSGNGTTTFNIPDYRDRFIVGAGNSYANYAKGGYLTNDISHVHTVNSHTHSVSAHTHDAGTYMAQIVRTSQYEMYIKHTSGVGWTSDIKVNLYNSSGNASGMGSGVDINGDSGSSGSGNTGASAPSTSTGGSTTLDNRPPYVGGLWIVRVL